MPRSVRQAPAGSCSTAQVVGNAFVQQYYHILHQSPELVYRFYQDSSKLCRPGENGVMGITTTMQAINKKILSLHYGEIRAEIKTVDAQESFNRGVLVLVTGCLTGKDNVTRNFTQNFFLAPQDKGYFVLNDVFRYVEDIKHQNGNQGMNQKKKKIGNQGLVNEVEAPLTPDQDPSPVHKNHVYEQTTVLLEEVNGEEVYNPSENGEVSVLEEESLIAEVVDEIQDDSQMVAESNTKIEEVPKKSYASIVKVMKENPVPLSTATTASMKSVPKSVEQQVAAALPPAAVAETPVLSSNVIENGNNQMGIKSLLCYFIFLLLFVTFWMIEKMDES